MQPARHGSPSRPLPTAIGIEGNVRFTGGASTAGGARPRRPRPDRLRLSFPSIVAPTVLAQARAQTVCLGAVHVLPLPEVTGLDYVERLNSATWVPGGPRRGLHANPGALSPFALLRRVADQRRTHESDHPRQGRPPNQRQLSQWHKQSDCTVQPGSDVRSERFAQSGAVPGRLRIASTEGES